MDETDFATQERIHNETTNFTYGPQEMIGQCMSLEARLHEKGLLVEEALIQEVRRLLVKVGARLEIPLETR